MIISQKMKLFSYNDYPNATLKEAALFKSITQVLSGKEQFLETFSLILHTTLFSYYFKMKNDFI